MCFVDLLELKGKYSTGIMKSCVDQLIRYNSFHCLFAGDDDSALEVQHIFSGTLPPHFFEWVKTCDGGLLFDTVLLSTKSHILELDVSVDTYKELNSPEEKYALGLPEGYTIFAMRSYGDPICFRTNDNDDKVYLWNIEKSEFDNVWGSFEHWLSEEISDAIVLIEEGALEPLGVKIWGDRNE